MQIRRAVAALTALALTAATFGLAASSPVAALGPLTFTVDVAYDAVDANLGDGICDDGTGHCTLRAAVMEANTTPDTDTIDLSTAPATLNLTIPGAGNASAASGDLDVTEPVRIVDNTYPFTTVTNTMGDRAFDVLPAPGAPSVPGGGGSAFLYLYGVDISGGAACGTAANVTGDCADPGGHDGSGIRVRGASLTTYNGTISGTGVVDAVGKPVGEGGAIYHRGPGLATTLYGGAYATKAARGGAVSSDDFAPFSSTIGGGSNADQGGGLYVPEGGHATIFPGLYGLAREGGLIYAAAGAVVDILYQKGYSLGGGTATERGGGVYLAGAANGRPGAQLTLGDLKSSSAGIEGGGAYVGPGAELIVRGGIVSGNSATGAGGVVANHGRVLLERSDVRSNSSTGSGGVIENFADGTVNVLNSTFVGNTAGVGGTLLDNHGVANVSFVTMSDVVTTAPAISSAAGASTTVGASIVSGPGGGCSGQVTFAAANFVSGNAPIGCAFTGPAPLRGDPQLGIEAYYVAYDPATGGLPYDANNQLIVPTTITREPAAGSPALDLVSLSDCLALGGSKDQRGYSRPGLTPTGLCDLGAAERFARLDIVSVNLVASASTAPMGVFDVPTSAIDPAALDTPPATTAGGALVATPATAASTGIGETSVANPPSLDSPLKSIPIRSIDVQAAPIRSIPIRSIPLASIPIRSIAGDWATILVGTQWEGRPLQTVSLGDVLGDPALATRLASVSLADLDLSNTPIRSIPLASIVLTGVPIRSIPLPAGQSWCAIVTAAGVPCGDSTPGAGGAVAGGIDIATDSLLSLSLAGVPIRSIPLASIPIRSINLVGTAIGAIKLNGIPIRSIPLGSIPIRSIPLASSPIGAIPIRSIPIRSIPIRSIPLASVNPALYDCAAISAANGGAACPGTLTLANVPESTFTASATLGELPIPATDTTTLADLGTYGNAALSDIAPYIPVTDATTFGDLASYADVTLGQLLDSITGAVDDNSLTLGAVLRGLLPRSDYPWKAIDLDKASLQRTPGALPDLPVHYTLTMDRTTQSLGGSLAGFVMNAILPVGAVYKPGSARLIAGPSTASSPFAPNASALPDGRVKLEWLPSGDVVGGYSVEFDAWPGTTAGGLAVVGNAQATLYGTGTPTVKTATAQAITQVAPSFEPNDTPAQATPITADHLYLSQIQQPGDVDLYTIVVPAGARLSVSLGHLPADYDMVLYSPTATSLRQSPTRSILPVADPIAGPAGVLVDQSPVQADMTIASLPVYATASHRGTADETIDTAPLPAGTYTLQVSGFNGASSPLAYNLRAKITTAVSNRPACAARTFADPSVAPSTASSAALPTNSPDTVFLVAPHRFAGLYGAAAAAQVDAALATFTDPALGSAQLGTVSAAVHVDDDPGVRAAMAAYDAAGTRCDPASANAVVKAIGSLLDAIPTARNVVVVGADDVIPFARVHDGTSLSNENEYASTFTGNNELVGALDGSYLLTDNPYGDAHPTQVGERQLFVPTIAVGRLVESPDQIVGALSQFLSSSGRVDPTTGTPVKSLSTGYDFLADGAAAVRANLNANGFTTGAVGDLINDTWSSNDLSAALTQFTTSPNLASVNAHFDHYRALSAKENTASSQSDLFSVNDIANPVAPRTSPDLSRWVLFSMGCHAGLSVADTSFNGTLSGTTSNDWAQTFAGKNTAVWAANTGFGYGDTTLVAASEALMAGFSANLGRAATVGEAMTLAKQKYAADQGVLSPYDEKVVSEVAFYGLPMYKLGNGTIPTTPGVATTPVAGTSLQSSSVTVTPNFGASPLSAGGGRGQYWSADDGVQTTNLQPVQPKVLRDVTATDPTLVARGAVIESATSLDTAGVDPFVFRPIVDLGANEPEPLVSGSAFPSALQAVNPYTGSGGARHDQLVLVPGQFISASNGASVGTQRTFSTLQTTVLYAPATSTDTTPPVVTSVVGGVSGANAAFTVQTSDPSGIARVAVLYSDANTPAGTTRVWQHIDLTSGPSSWTGSGALSGATELDYYVQVVDGAGNVAISSNKGTLHRAAAPPLVTITAPAVDGNGGTYRTSPTITLLGSRTAADLASLSYTTTFTPAGSAPVTSAVKTITSPATDGSLSTSLALGDGVTTVSVTVTDAAGRTSTASRVFTVDTTDPSVVVLGTPASGWFLSSPVTLQALPGGSPVKSVSYRVGGGAFTTVQITSANPYVAVAIPAEGVTTLDYYATDLVGRSSPIITTPIRVDGTPPTITSVSPVSGTALAVGQVVNLTYTAADTGSGIASCTGPPSGSPIDTSVAGPITITLRCTDVAGLSTSVTVAYTVVGSVGVSISAAAPNGLAGWYVTSPVPVSVTATGSVGTAPASITVSTSGAQVSGPVTSTNATSANPFTIGVPIAAEGVTTVSASAASSIAIATATPLTVKLDTVAPVVSCPVPAGAVNGWFGTNPTITCTAVDAAPGSGVVPNAVLTTTTSVGANVAATATASLLVPDVAGNVGVGTATVKVDQAKPTISLTAPLDPLGPSYVVGQPVTVTCLDADSGLAVSGGCVTSGSFDTLTPGTRTFSVTATDQVGNITTQGFSYTVRAAVGPSVVITAASAPTGSNGWYLAPISATATVVNGDFTPNPVTLSASGAQSGSVTGSGSASTTVTTNGITTLTATVNDGHGNSASSALTVKLDTAAPTITAISPASGTSLSVGQVVSLTYATGDVGSGIASCTGPASGTAIDTSAARTVAITLSCTDLAGLVTSVALSYPVVAPTGWGPTAGTTFTISGSTVSFAKAAASATYTNNLWWSAASAARTGSFAARLTLTATGASSARGSGVFAGATRDSTGKVVGGYTVQFDPAYDCRTKSGGGLIGALVIQRWGTNGQPQSSTPVACTAAPTEFYASASAASLDLNKRFWSKPLDLAVTATTSGASSVVLKGTITYTGANGVRKTLTASATVATSTTGPAWGLRTWGDVAGSLTTVVMRVP